MKLVKLRTIITLEYDAFPESVGWMSRLSAYEQAGRLFPKIHMAGTTISVDTQIIDESDSQVLPAMNLPPIIGSNWTVAEDGSLRRKVDCK